VFIFIFFGFFRLNQKVFKHFRIFKIMDGKEIEWLKQNNLLQIAKNYVDIFKKIFVNCLNVQKERVLIIGDTGFVGKRIAPIMSSAYYLAAKELNLDADLLLEEPKSKGDEADLNIITALESLEEGNIIIINSTNRIGSLRDLSRSFRRFAKSRKHRFISTSSLNLDTQFLTKFISALDIDYKALQDKSQKIKAVLDKGKEIHATTEAGTDLYYNIKGKKAISAGGHYIVPASGGNLPAGEVYAPCRGKNVDGRVIVDGSSRNRMGTLLVKEPIKIEIKKGSIVNIEGGEEAKLLQESLDWAYKKAKYPWGVKRIGEFGIGLNPKAELIGSIIMDEKVLGTSHIAIGSNYWFGGSIYAIIHLDQVFKNPRIFIDGEELII